MNSKAVSRLTLLISLLMIVSLTACNLPTVTPPPDTFAAEAPTSTEIVPPTLEPPTSTPALQAAVISNTNASKLAATNKAAASNVQFLGWSADGSTLSLVSQNTDANGVSTFSATLLDGSSLAVKTVWMAPDSGQITQVSPNGLAAVITSDMKTLNLYDLKDNARNIVSLTPQYTLGGATFSADGKYFTVTDYDNMAVSLHSLPDGSEVKVYNGFTTAAPVFNVGFSGNSVDLVWHARATLQVQNLVSGTLGTAFESEDFVSAYQLSPDGKMLASSVGKTINGNFEPVVTLWDTTSGQVLTDLVLSTPAPALGLCFSPDGSLLAVAAGNNVQIWNVATGSQIATLTGHSATVNLLAFSPDGKTLASVGQDNQLILWQVLQ